MTDSPTYLLINGSFGIGKTTTTRILHTRIPRSVVFDPEHIGWVLQRLPGYRASDFQHLPLWRRLTVWGAKLAGFIWPVVLIPMTFTELAYLEEVRTGLTSPNHTVLHICLTAPLSVIQDRLAARGQPLHDPRFSWVHRRAAECCAAHAQPAFAIHLPTENMSPTAVAAHIAAYIKPNVSRDGHE